MYEATVEAETEGDIGHLRLAIVTHNLTKIKALLDGASTKPVIEDAGLYTLPCSQQEILMYGNPEYWARSCLVNLLIPTLHLVLCLLELLGLIIEAYLPSRFRIWYLMCIASPYKEPVSQSLPYGIDLEWVEWVKRMGVLGDEIMAKFLRRRLNLGSWSNENSVGNDLLRWAVTRGFGTTLQVLLDLGLPIDGSGRDYCVPLALAVTDRRKVLIPLLLPRELRESSDFWTRKRTSYCEDKYGETILCMAIRSTPSRRALEPKDFQDVLLILKMLLKAGADANTPCEGNATPLSLACQELFSDDMIGFLLDEGVHETIAFADNTGSTALHYAVKNEYLISSTQMVELLLKHNAPVNVWDNEGHSSLWYVAATPSGPSESIVRLVGAGAIVDFRQKGTSTPLMEACKTNLRKQYSSCQTLIDLGAAVNAHSGNLTPSLIVLREGSWSPEDLESTYVMIDGLISRGAHVMLPPSFPPPLIEAAKRNYAPVTRLCLDKVLDLAAFNLDLLSRTMVALCFQTESKIFGG